MIDLTAMIVFAFGTVVTIFYYKMRGDNGVVQIH